MKVCCPVIEHAGHRCDHGQPRHEHGTPRRGGGDVESLAVGPPGRALLALTPDVEQRVVHADRQADQQHHRAGRRIDVQAVAGQREQAAGGHHRGEREDERHERGHQRTEGDEQDPERERDRDRLGAGEILADRVVDRLGGRRGPELLDAEPGMTGGDAVHRAQHGLDTLGGGVGLALHREEDDRGALVAAHLSGVGRGQRRADVLDPAGRVDGGDDVAHRVPSGGAQYLPAPSDLHEHLLGGGALEAGTLQRAAGRGRLSVTGLDGGQLLPARIAADGGGQQHEDEPTDDRPGAMSGAPATGPRGDPECACGPHGLPFHAMNGCRRR